MQDKLQKITNEELAKLPKELQDAIGSLDWGKLVGEIGKAHALTEIEINDLQTETLLILIGLERPEYFAKNIENNIGTTTKEAESMASEIGEKVFQSIYDKFSEIMQEVINKKRTNWKENIGFILGGGDYSIFLEKSDHETIVQKPEKNLGNTKNIEEVKNQLNLK